MISTNRAVVVASLVLAQVASAQPAPETRPVSERPVAGEDDQLYACKNAKGPVMMTFKPETELKDLMTWVMGFTCKNFILDPRIISTGKKVTVIAPNKMSPTEAYRLFLVALSTINLTIVPKGNVIRIVDAPTAKKDTPPIFKSGLPDASDQIVRYIYKPSYAQVETLQQAFTALRSDAGDIQLIGSILLITDYGSHVRDMMSLAHLIDVASGSDGIYTLTVNHADAAKLADEITTILGLGAKPGAPVPAGTTGAAVSAAVPSKILVDERTNTLIIAASAPGYNRVKALVERLDVALDIEGGTAIHVYRLGSAIAEELAKTLNDAVTTTQKDPKAAKPAAGGSPMVDALGTAIEGQVKVIADPPTNSLIVLSSGRDFFAIRDVIKQLDLPRRQVYIEAMILEVQLSDGMDVGSSSHGGVSTDDGSSLVLGGVQMPNLKSTNLETLGAATGLVTGLVGSALPGSEALLGTSIPSYAVLFTAIASQSNTNVLSAPSIIALDNAEAKYKVGTNIPFKRGQTIGGTGNLEGSVTSSIDRMDLLLELVIKPHVSIDDSVLLEIKHDAKELAKENAELGPTWTTRSFETRVLVRDQQTVVIGGLMQEREIDVKDKVPFLGDIPVLGRLFSSSSKKKTKSNLVIMLTPYIVKDQMDLEAIRSRRVREHDEFTKSFGALDRMPYRAATDFRRKRGLVEEINRAVQSVEEDIAARGSVSRPATIPQGVIEYRTAD